MRYEQFMALRYLRGAQGREEGRRFLRFITFIAIGGVAVGVAALLLAFAIVRGFAHEIERKITGFGAHVQIENYQDFPLANADSLRRRLEGRPEVIEATPVVMEFVLLRSATEIDGVSIWGSEETQPFIEAHIREGAFSFAPDAEGRPGIVIGTELARLLGAGLGDRVTAFSMRHLDAPGALPGAGLRPRVRQFYVAGLYETGLVNFDELYALTDIDVARALVDYRSDQVSRFDLTLADVRQASAVADAIEEDLGFPIMARSIYMVYRNIFAWVDMQRNIVPLLIGSIIVVAAFNIIAALLMVILEKGQEIGILLSMGVSKQTLKSLFLWLGGLVGVTGSAIGSGLALLLAVLQQRYEIIRLPQEAYYMTHAPVAPAATDFLIVVSATILLCLAASYIPARVAARIDPIKTIRFAA